MSSANAWSRRSSALPFGGGWTSRTRYAPADFAALLWRERRLMLTVFLAIAAVGVLAALTMKSSYTASSSVLVRLGQEYVYQPTIGDAGKGVAPQGDQVVQAEAEILGSDPLRERTIDALGFGRVFPKQRGAWERATPEKRSVMMAKGVAALGKALKVTTAPNTSVIQVSFEYDDPAVSALVLNSLLDQYLVYRKQVLLGAAGPVTVEQQKVLQTRLDQAEGALQDFLGQSGIGDFDNDKSSLNALTTSITDESFRVQARLQEVEGRLRELSRQAGAVPAEISLYQDSSAAANDRLLQLRLDREDLLSRYRAESQPVRDIDQKIAKLEAMVREGRGASAGASRTGVNPVYQTMQTERIQLSAEAASLRGRAAALSEQMQSVTAGRRRLSTLEPRYQELARERDVLAANLKDLTTKIEADASARAIALVSRDNIRVVEKASVPIRGKSLRKPVAIFAFLFGAFTALCVGLMRIFLQPGVPTPSAAERTFDLPVLATAGLKVAAR
jgi:uncharacterized protein involved in exopolysaccharide biosynthesis